MTSLTQQTEGAGERTWLDPTGLYYYRARYYDPQIERFISEDPLGLSANGTNLYAYAGNDPIDVLDPTGCNFTSDCREAVAELEAAFHELFRREAENVKAGKCDDGHDKAIEDAKRRVRNAIKKVTRCFPKEIIDQLLDAIKKTAEDLGNRIWDWLNNDPRQNWPGIYGPMPGQAPLTPIGLPPMVPIGPEPVPIGIFP